MHALATLRAYIRAEQTSANSFVLKQDMVSGNQHYKLWLLYELIINYIFTHSHTN